MAKKKEQTNTSKKKKSNRLDAEKKKRLIADINSGMRTTDLMRKYKTSDKTVQSYRKKILEERNKKPVSVLDMKKALDLAKANSMLHYSMEQMEVGMKRIDADHSKNSPSTQIKMAVEVAKITLEIHNTIYFMETPDIGVEGYNPDDVDLTEMVMEMMTDKQKEDLFEKFTGQSLGAINAPKPADDKPASDKT